jgi:hypothetical protein
MVDSHWKSFDDIINKAKKKIIESRNIYSSIYEFLGVYCAKNDMIIMGELANILLSNILTKDEYHSKVVELQLNFNIEICCSRPFQHTMTIAKGIYDVANDDVDPITVRFDTIIEDHYYIIYIGMMQIVTIVSLPELKLKSGPCSLGTLLHNKSDVIDVANDRIDIISKFVTDKSFTIMPPEHQLISWYQDKYMPCSGVIDIENIIWDKIKVYKLEEKQNTVWREKVFKVCQEYFKNFVFISINLNSPIRMMAKQESIKFIIDTLRDRLNMNVSHNGVKVHILDDIRLKKTVVYVKVDSKELGVMEIYNSIEYELIPYYNDNKMLIANKYVQLRFLLIEAWVRKIIKCSTNEGIPDYIYNRMKEIRQSDDKIDGWEGVIIPITDTVKKLKLSNKFNTYYVAK